MIKISLDEGYVFDILSILQVKIFKTSKENKKINSSFEKMKHEIIQQIGEQKFNEIFLSPEYANLFNANSLTFDLVDKVKTDDGIGKKVDDANYHRYICKTNLQKKFFNNEVSEIKIGYK